MNSLIDASPVFRHFPAVMKNIRSLTPEEFEAMKAAAYMHGRQFKHIIRICWINGAYESNCLVEHDGTLQRMRNSPGGRALLDSLRVKDYCVNPRVAFLMGEGAARGEGPLSNPFGVPTLADAWRKGYAKARTLKIMNGEATPQA